MKIVAIVQARIGSTRLPGKVLKEINDKTILEIILLRLKKSKKINQIVVAIPNNTQNQGLAEYINNKGFDIYLGDEHNVLNRYYEAAIEFKADIIVRITGDCPIVDANLIDDCILALQEQKLDYCNNLDPLSYPDGIDVEVLTYDSLHFANSHASTLFDKEHVTSFIRNHPKTSKGSLVNPVDYSNLRWSIDEHADYEVIRAVFNYFAPDIYFDWKSVIELYNSNPEIFSTNKHIKNNEGSLIGLGPKLYKRSKSVIPGGGMLLSKRPEMFLPEFWPSYYSKSKGCEVWDLDGKKYFDMSLMGIGTNILGYGNAEVDEAVNKAIKDGNMSTLNCPEEVYLAEKLIEMHPWSEMVRFARSGGEINSVAVRIARSYSGKDKIAICGYHGWHDWYLSTNLQSDNNLDELLLPGLKPNGVPKGLKGSTLPFRYNNIEELEQIIKSNHEEIAAIKMEVARNQEPKDGYLQKVRDLATENNIILIFDECTSGFRESFGGLHKKYGVEPDLAIFGKALGNGYAISACIGKAKYMQAAQKTFISSTFWTERIGPCASLKTLEVMERENSWKKITATGINITSRWKALAKKYNLEINTSGLPALCGFSFNSSSHLAYKTFISQEMLKEGFLASNSIYVCIKHDSIIVNNYFESLEPIFEIIKECELGKQSINSLLDGAICHNGFSRLN